MTALKPLFFAMTLLVLLSDASPSPGSAWKSATPMPHGRYGHDAVLGKDGRIYVMGGMVCDIKDGKMGYDYPDGRFSNLRYDIGRGAWEYRCPVVWGSETSGRYFTFDPNTYEVKNYEPSRPEDLKKLPPNARKGELNREGCGVRILAGANGKIYWLGGMGIRWGNGESKVLDYDPREDRWTRIWGEPILETPAFYDVRIVDNAEIPQMLERRMDHEAVMTSDGNIYVMGGWRRAEKSPGVADLSKPNEVSDTMECYDPTTKKWTYKKPLSQKRMAFAAVLGPDERIYVFGGAAGMVSDKRTLTLDIVEIYDPNADTWSTGSSMPEPRDSHDAALGPDGKIYVIGGSTAGGPPVKDVFIYDPKADKWRKGPSMNTARAVLAAVATPDGKIYAIGGTDVGAHGGSDTLNTFIPRKSHLYTGRVQETVEVLDISK